MGDDRNYWLVKSEPETFSINDLAASPRQTTYWDGVRNYQARNFMQAMRVGDRVLFYHSSVEPPQVVGLAMVVREAYPDSTSWDPNELHYDPKATPADPIWSMIDLQLAEIFPQPISLDQLRGVAALSKMELLRKGSRLSVQPVGSAEFNVIMGLAHVSKRSTSKAAAAKPMATKKPASARKPIAAKPRVAVSTKQKVVAHAGAGAKNGRSTGSGHRAATASRKSVKPR